MTWSKHADPADTSGCGCRACVDRPELGMLNPTVCRMWAALAPVEGRYRALPGEPITLTDAQIEEWRRGQRTPEECYEIARQIGRKMDASARLHQRQFFARYDEILKHCFVTPLRAKR